jgi:hypothetical protein
MDIDTQRIQRLVEKLHNPNKDVRFEACEWLRALPVITPEAIIALQEAINDPDEEVRHSAQTALAVHLFSTDSSRQEKSGVQKVDVKKKHSELGIASFIIASIETFVWIFSLLTGIQYPTWVDEQLFLIVFIGGPLVALMLGIGGLLQKNRKKGFSILGIGFSSLVLFIFGCLMYILSHTI